MHPVLSAVNGLKVGPARTLGGLSMFTLCSNSMRTVEYLLLSEALKTGIATVREVSYSGSVSDLVVDNRSHQPILIVDGEELIGAK